MPERPDIKISRNQEISDILRKHSARIEGQI